MKDPIERISGDNLIVAFSQQIIKTEMELLLDIVRITNQKASPAIRKKRIVKVLTDRIDTFNNIIDQNRGG